VRAMYLLTAVADLVRVEGSSSVRSETRTNVLHRLWENMTTKKMYLTGGIGSQKQWEGFGIDYFLPSGTDEGGCYAETCGTFGQNYLWNSRSSNADSKTCSRDRGHDARGKASPGKDNVHQAHPIF
jgi:DUF1680 family protein